MLLLPLERDGANGLLLRLALRRVLLFRSRDWMRARGRDPDRDMLLDKSRD